MQDLKVLGEDEIALAEIKNIKKQLLGTRLVETLSCGILRRYYLEVLF